MTTGAMFIFIILTTLIVAGVVLLVGTKLIDYYLRLKWHYISQAAKHINEEYIKYTNKRRTL